MWQQLDNGSWMRRDDPGEPLSPVGRVSIAREEGWVLSELAQGRAVLEIGTGLGISTHALADTAHSVWTVDPDEWVEREIVPGLVARGINCSRGWPSPGPAFGLIFIDGQHSSTQVESDTRAALARLQPGGIVIWHDWNSPEVRAGAMKGLGRAEGIEVRPTTHGLGIFRQEAWHGHA